MAQDDRLGVVLGDGDDLGARRPDRVASEDRPDASHLPLILRRASSIVRSVTESPSGRDESEAERLDRNLGELLQELRVALPGVQVLFAFLLAVPFQQNFTEITPFQEKAYFATLLFTAISAALLIAPSAYHRITFRLQRRRSWSTSPTASRSSGSASWRWR